MIIIRQSNNHSTSAPKREKLLRRVDCFNFIISIKVPAFSRVGYIGTEAYLVRNKTSDHTLTTWTKNSYSNVGQILVILWCTFW